MNAKGVMTMQHIFIIGAKGCKYGEYETFLDKLTEFHKDNKKSNIILLAKQMEQELQRKRNLKE